MRVLRYGERALLLEVGSHLVADYVQAIEDADIAEIEAIVPAAETVLVKSRSASDLGSLEFRLQAIEPVNAAETDTHVVVIDVDYNGPDLSFVASETGMSVAEVVHAHTSVDHRVQFCGFAPGFGYLTGLDPLLQLARRSSPRTRVPPGSLAIAGPYSAVYPTASPGGWHLLGTTDAVLFAPERFAMGESPALLRPGSLVRFVARSIEATERSAS